MYEDNLADLKTKENDVRLGVIEKRRQIGVSTRELGGYIPGNQLNTNMKIKLLH
jgi:hypothetical protein